MDLLQIFPQKFLKLTKVNCFLMSSSIQLKEARVAPVVSKACLPGNMNGTVTTADTGKEIKEVVNDVVEAVK
jgi:hypothetical protein